LSIKSGISPLELLASADEYPNVIIKMIDIYRQQAEEEKRQEMRSKL